jgi:hypothetical protein
MFSPSVATSPQADDFVRVYHGQVRVAIQLQTDKFEDLYGGFDEDNQKKQREAWEHELNHYFFQDDNEDGALVTIKGVKQCLRQLQLNLSVPIGCYAKMVDDMKQQTPTCLIRSLSHLSLTCAEPLADHALVRRMVALCVIGEDKRDLWQLTSESTPILQLPEGIQTAIFKLALDSEQRKQLSHTPVHMVSRKDSLVAASTSAIQAPAFAIHVPRPPPMLGVNYWATEEEWDPTLDGHWGGNHVLSS